jgi:hypothetical protein
MDIDPQESVDFITESLAFEGLSSCVLLFLGHATVIPFVFEQTDQVADCRKLDIRFNALRDGIVRWICYPRTPSELHTLASSSCICSLTGQRSAAHVLGQQVFQGDPYHRRPFVPLLECMFNIFTATLLPIYKSNAINVRFDTIIARSVWPTSVECLLPHGPEDTIRGLLSWMAIGLDDSRVLQLRMLSAINILFMITRPCTLPYMVTSEILLPHGIIPAINKGCAILEEGLILKKPQPHHERATKLLHTCSGLLADLVDKACDEVQRTTFTEAHRTTLLMACGRSMRALRDAVAYLGLQDSGTLRESREAFLHTVWLLGCDHPSIQRLRLSPDMRSHLMAIPYRLDSPWVRMLQFLDCVTRDFRCGSPDCERTFFNPTHFRRCAGCRRVAYCSRQCQKESWNHPAVPHRQICSMLWRICVAYDLPRRYASILMSGIKEPSDVDGDDLLSIVEHFAARTRYEMIHSCTWYHVHHIVRKAETVNSNLQVGGRMARRNTVRYHGCMMALVHGRRSPR